MNWCRLCFLIFLFLAGACVVGCFYKPILYVCGFIALAFSALEALVAAIVAKAHEYP